MDKIEKEIRFLKIYSLILTILFFLIFGCFFILLNKSKFEEINVERINVVEKDGKLRMVISNKHRQHPGVMDGIVYEERKGQRPPGMMFFNEKGDELGGLVFDGNNEMGQGGSLTFDKFRGDQTIQFIHEEDKDGNYFSGVKMNDQNLPINDLINKQNEIVKLPTKEAQIAAWKELKDKGLLMTERIRVGKEYDKSSIIKMRDSKGILRIEIKVESNGDSVLNFYDHQGNVIYSIPPKS